jgi:hypothetical protein
MKMGLHPWQYEHESRMKATQAHIHDYLKQQKASENLPPVPKPARTCRACGKPLKDLSDCSLHAAAMRDYRTEFDLGTNWSAKLSEFIAEEFRLEERETELNTLAESIKGKSDEVSREKLRRILGYDFKSKITLQAEHRDGLIDLVKNRLAEIRKALPTLTRAADSYLQEELNVPTEGMIFQQRKQQDNTEKILR